jgi:lysophospholipase L1-like esterase
VNPLLLPIVALQGMWVRHATELLPPATGPTIGTVGDPSRPPVRIAVVGESTAAGCGVHTHDEGFPGWLARELAARTRRPVTWEVVGQHAATARRIRYRLLPQLGDNLNVAVLLAGGNDVLAGRTPGQWRDDLAAIVDDLTNRAEQVAVTGIPPFAAFPSLPTTLGRYLAQRAAAFDELSQRVCAEQPRAVWISSTSILPTGPDMFAQDRFHPSAAGYRRWAQAVAGHLAL